MAINVRLLQDHNEECRMGGYPEVERWWAPGDVVWRNDQGQRPGASTKWMVVECIDPGCVGRMIVRCSDIVGLAVEARLDELGATGREV